MNTAMNTAMNTQSAMSVSAKYHSALAMEAARRMRHTKEKRRMGKLVCHHLRMMLADANGCYAKQPTPRDRDQYRLGF